MLLQMQRNLARREAATGASEVHPCGLRMGLRASPLEPAQARSGEKPRMVGGNASVVMSAVEGGPAAPAARMARLFMNPEQTNQGQLLRPRGRRVQKWVTLAISAGNPVIAP